MLLLWLCLQDAASIDLAAKSVAGMDVRQWKLVDDAAFLERVTRDLWGEAAADAGTFIADKSPDKRSRKIDELLASPKFAALWGRRLSDLLIGPPADYRIPLAFVRVEGERAIADAFLAWMTEGVAADRPWTETVSAVIDARGEAPAVPELAWKLGYAGRPQEALGKGFGASYVFLGIRLGCAACHDHPFDKWTVENAYGMAAFFARERLRSVAGKVELKVADEGELTIPRPLDANDKDSKVKLAQGGTAPPMFLFGGAPGKNDDRLKVLAGFMTSKANTQVPRAFANRVWGWLFGKGVVDPPDDFNLRNKASSPALMDRLTRALADNGHRLKPLLRAICNSEIYQNVELTEPAKAEWSSFRGMIVKSPYVSPKPFGPFKLALPPEWTPLPIQRIGGFPVPYRVPDKDGKGGPARFGAWGGSGEGWLNQVVGGKPVVEKFEGPLQVTLTDVAGTYTCDPLSVGPRDKWRILVGLVQKEKVNRHFRLEGPAETVEDWKDAFVEMLRKAEIP